MYIPSFFCTRCIFNRNKPEESYTIAQRKIIDFEALVKNVFARNIHNLTSLRFANRNWLYPVIKLVYF